nr:unnamed protein product [Spirometra erinaceieuropaei]
MLLCSSSSSSSSASSSASSTTTTTTTQRRPLRQPSRTSLTATQKPAPPPALPTPAMRIRTTPALTAIAPSPHVSAWSVTCEFITQRPVNQCLEHQPTPTALASTAHTALAPSCIAWVYSATCACKRAEITTFPTRQPRPSCPAPPSHRPSAPPPTPPLELILTPPTSHAHTVHANSPHASAWSVACESIAQRPENQCLEHQPTPTKLVSTAYTVLVLSGTAWAYSAKCASTTTCGRQPPATPHILTLPTLPHHHQHTSTLTHRMHQLPPSTQVGSVHLDSVPTRLRLHGSFESETIPTLQVSWIGWLLIDVRSRFTQFVALCVCVLCGVADWWAGNGLKQHLPLPSHASERHAVQPRCVKSWCFCVYRGAKSCCGARSHGQSTVAATAPVPHSSLPTG